MSRQGRSSAALFGVFPDDEGRGVGLYPVSVFLCYFALLILPVVINIREDRKWNALISAA